MTYPVQLKNALTDADIQTEKYLYFIMCCFLHPSLKLNTYRNEYIKLIFFPDVHSRYYRAIS